MFPYLTRMLKLVLFVLPFSFSFCLADQVIEKDGKKVLLKDDGTWEFAEEVVTAGGRKVILREDGTWEYLERSEKPDDEACLPRRKHHSGEGIFWVYNDNDSRENRFLYPGLLGDYDDIKYYADFKQNVYSGENCARIIYSAKARQGIKWAGLCWQKVDPACAAGKKTLDPAASFSRFVFYARGQKGGERIEEFKAGPIEALVSGPSACSIGPVVLTKEWKKYSIDLSGKEISAVNAGFSFRISAESNPKGAAFYLDEMYFEP